MPLESGAEARHSVDPEMVTTFGAASTMGGCRTEKQLHSVAGALQIDLHSCSLKHQAMEQKRYWLACRRLMCDGPSDCIAVGGKRSGGSIFSQAPS